MKELMIKYQKLKRGTETVRHHHRADESCRGRDRGIEAYLSNGMGAALQ